MTTMEIDAGWTLCPALEAKLTKKPNTSSGSEKGRRLVDLNSATLSELCSLPGIGRARAAQIVSWRASNGPLLSPKALLAISGIGARTLELLTPRLA